MAQLQVTNSKSNQKINGTKNANGGVLGNTTQSNAQAGYDFLLGGSGGNAGTFVPKQASQKETAPGNVLGANTAATANPNADPAMAAYYGEQENALKSLLGVADSTLSQGKQSIEDSYNTGVARTNEDTGKALRNIGVKREESSQDKVARLGEIDDSVLRRGEGVQRMANQRGAGISGAAQIFAPAAIGRQGTEERGGVFTTFGRNARALDLAETDTNDQSKRALEDLITSKTGSMRDLESGVSTQKLTLNQQLQEAAARRAIAEGGGAAQVTAATSPYTSNVDAIRAALASLFDSYRAPSVSAAPINANIPELQGYTTDPTTGQQPALSAGAADDGLLSLIPYLKPKTQGALI